MARLTRLKWCFFEDFQSKNGKKLNKMEKSHIYIIFKYS
jgi:hypothetical protein